jgi:hypothetical protein
MSIIKSICFDQEKVHDDVSTRMYKKGNVYETGTLQPYVWNGDGTLISVELNTTSPRDKIILKCSGIRPNYPIIMEKNSEGKYSFMTKKTGIIWIPGTIIRIEFFDEKNLPLGDRIKIWNLTFRYSQTLPIQGKRVSFGDAIIYAVILLLAIFISLVYVGM